MIKFCPYCGTKIQYENTSFCANCGKELGAFPEENSKKETSSVLNDFFTEMPQNDTPQIQESSADNNHDDFFSSMENEVDKQNDIDKELLNKAEILFLKYKLREAKPILEDLASRNNWRAQYMLSMTYQQDIYANTDLSFDTLFNAIKSINDSYEDNIDAMIVELRFVRQYMVDNDSVSTSDLKAAQSQLQKRIAKVGKVDDILAEYELGEYYFSQELGQQNTRKSLAFMESSAQKGFWAASEAAGVLCYIKGDIHKAKKHLRPVAEKGLRNPIITLAKIYSEEGNDIKRAEHWASKGVAFNDSTCIYILGLIREQDNKYFDAIRLHEKNIQINNDYDSMIRLGLIYLNTNDNPAIPTDRAKSEQFFLQALKANNNSAEAYFYLGCVHIYKGDNNTAKQYLQQAYNLGEGEIKEQALSTLKQIQEFEQNQSQNNGCFITTAVCDSFGKADNCYELTTFRNFRDTWLRKQKDGESLINEYYNIAPRIVSHINLLDNAKEVYRSIWLDYLKPCLSALENNDNISCKKQYIKMVMDLKEKYL